MKKLTLNAKRKKCKLVMTSYGVGVALRPFLDRRYLYRLQLLSRWFYRVFVVRLDFAVPFPAPLLFTHLCHLPTGGLE